MNLEAEWSNYTLSVMQRRATIHLHPCHKQKRGTSTEVCVSSEEVTKKAATIMVRAQVIPPTVFVLHVPFGRIKN